MQLGTFINEYKIFSYIYILHSLFRAHPLSYRHYSAGMFFENPSSHSNYPIQEGSGFLKSANILK